MRTVFCHALISLYSRQRFLFMTGDLGFMALEPLREAMGADFVNAGIAEQNMVAAAAGVSFSGLQSWVYSIAPFVYARPFEQIRNDVCLHDFDVKLVGNGGGYGYGYMGATHHAIEDYGVLLALQNMTCFIPAFADDVVPMVRKMAVSHHPAYLRLGRHEMPQDAVIPPYAQWRKLLAGSRGVAVTVGPVAAEAYAAVTALPVEQRPSLWVLAELPVLPDSVPAELSGELSAPGSYLMVIEEHVAHGGAGMILSHLFALLGVRFDRFLHLHAIGYPPKSGYGSQQFHRRLSGIDSASIARAVKELA